MKWRLVAVAALCAASCAGGRETGTLDASVFCNDDDQCPVGQTCQGGVCANPADAGEPADAALAPAEIVVSPLTLDFGNALLGVDTSLPVEITNAGQADLHVTNITVYEADALPEYTAAPSGATTLTLAAGESAMVLVTLRPLDDQPDVGELRIASDDADEPQVVVSLVSDLKGTPDLQAVPAAIDYGTVSWGTTTTRDVDVTNVGTGNAPLVIDGVSVTNTSGEGDLYTTELFLVLPGDVEVSTAVPVFLSAGDATTPADVLRVRVSFLANTASSGAAPDEDLVLTSNDPDPAEAQAHIPISGTVLGCETPQPEVCNGLDDNCDLTADEGDPGSGGSCDTGIPGICAPGVEHCIGGSITCVQDEMPTAEVCDNQDNDCDGAVDDGLLQACANRCGSPGVEFCVAGAWLGCNAPPEPTEVCDGIDNDCDGMTDEGDPGGGGFCSTGMPGICSNGTYHCVAGSVQCVPEAAPTTEVCNGADDDCDGMTDEGDPGGGAACTTASAGVCAPGHIHCVSGTLQCRSDVMPSTEVCNYLDDDCNGIVDNGFNLTNDINNCGSCGNVCSVSHATTTCSSSTCSIVSCTGGYVDTDGSYGDGCECADDGGETTPGSGDTCPASIAKGTVAEGGSVTISGKIATVGDEDWYEVAFTDAADSGLGTCDPFRPNIVFSSNPGTAYRFQVYNPDCSAYSTCGGASLTDFKYYSGAGTDHCCYNSPDPGPGLESCANQSFTVRIRVVKTVGSPTCDTYSLLVKNGP